ncbi:M16 family metallopeptidase [Kribbella catacumbae]|uniref:M16 family metallopeptidase n=1 Tax=Kribbella catacumbae TaxID=460086 RepID=UPI00037315AF|nr:pitrilysin family protein [Kribbella catacumbae]
MTPPYKDHYLENGLRVVAMRHPTVPLAEIRLSIDLPRTDASQAACTTLLAACLLADGISPEHPTPTLELARLGAELTATADPYGLIVSGRCPGSAISTVLNLLESVLRTGAPTVAVVARERERLARQLQVAQRIPQAVVRTALLRHLFGPHPLTIQLSAQEDIAAVTCSDVTSLWREAIMPSRACLLVVGNIAIDEVAAVFDSTFGEWTDHIDGLLPTPMPPLRAVAESDLTRVDDARLSRAHLSICATGVATDDHRYPALFLAGNILAGLTTSRLASSIRDRAGLVYSVSGYYEPIPGASLVHVLTDTARQFADEVLAKTYDELAQLSAEPPTAAEVDAARTCATGAFATRLAPQAALADAVAADLRRHQSPTETFRFRHRLREVTAQSVRSAAADFLHPDRFTGVLAGPVR